LITPFKILTLFDADTIQTALDGDIPFCRNFDLPRNDGPFSNSFALLPADVADLACMASIQYYLLVENSPDFISAAMDAKDDIPDTFPIQANLTLQDIPDAARRETYFAMYLHIVPNGKTLGTQYTPEPTHSIEKKILQKFEWASLVALLMPFNPDAMTKLSAHVQGNRLAVAGLRTLLTNEANLLDALAYIRKHGPSGAVAKIMLELDTTKDAFHLLQLIDSCPPKTPAPHLLWMLIVRYMMANLSRADSFAHYNTMAPLILWRLKAPLAEQTLYEPFNRKLTIPPAADTAVKLDILLDHMAEGGFDRNMLNKSMRLITSNPWGEHTMRDLPAVLLDVLIAKASAPIYLGPPEPEDPEWVPPAAAKAKKPRKNQPKDDLQLAAAAPPPPTYKIVATKTVVLLRDALGKTNTVPTLLDACYKVVADFNFTHLLDIDPYLGLYMVSKASLSHFTMNVAALRKDFDPISPLQPNTYLALFLGVWPVYVTLARVISIHVGSADFFRQVMNPDLEVDMVKLKAFQPDFNHGGFTSVNAPLDILAHQLAAFIVFRGRDIDEVNDQVQPEQADHFHGAITDLLRNQLNCYRGFLQRSHYASFHGTAAVLAVQANTVAASFIARLDPLLATKTYYMQNTESIAKRRRIEEEYSSLKDNTVKLVQFVTQTAAILPNEPQYETIISTGRNLSLALQTLPPL
jgi:hypothetical protein